MVFETVTEYQIGKVARQCLRELGRSVKTNEPNASVEPTPQREEVRAGAASQRVSLASSDKRHVAPLFGSDVDARRSCPFDTAVSVRLQRAVRRQT